MKKKSIQNIALIGAFLASVCQIYASCGDMPPEMSKGCPCQNGKTVSADIVWQRISNFKKSNPMQQRTQLADMVKQYISNPSEGLEQMIVGCANVYCERVQSQTINRLVQELITGDDKEEAQFKIMRTLGLR